MGSFHIFTLIFLILVLEDIPSIKKNKYDKKCGGIKCKRKTSNVRKKIIFNKKNYQGQGIKASSVVLLGNRIYMGVVPRKTNVMF